MSALSLLIGLLSFLLILVCLFLGLLILIQLPKKEAGMGAAFGGDATAALFGAGSGNALTTMTKWSAGIFVGLCILVSWMSAHQSRSRIHLDRDALNRTDTPAAGVVPALPILPGATSTTTVVIPSPATAIPTNVVPAPLPIPPK